MMTRSFARRATLVALCIVAGCDDANVRVLDDALQLSSRRSDDVLALTLTPRNGARLNALSAPALELTDGRVIRWTGARSDSAPDYFADGASASIDAAPRPLRGVLRAVTCPPKARVCQSHEVNVELR
jgi:hypothetical protein